MPNLMLVAVLFFVCQYSTYVIREKKVNCYVVNIGANVCHDMSKIVSNVIAPSNIPNRISLPFSKSTFFSSPSRLLKMSIILLSQCSVCVKLIYVVGINKLQSLYSIILFPAVVWISIFNLVASI